MVAAMILRRRRSAPVPVACALAAMLSAAPLAAQEPADSTRSHLVRPGDTLWDLARRYLGDPFRWSDIFQLNRERVADPDLILPAWLLRIPAPGELAAAVDTPPAFRPAPARTVFFEADRPAEGARLEFGRAADVPLVTAGDFHRAGMLVPEEEVVPVGRLQELVNPSVVPLEIPPQIGPYSRVFMTLAVEGAVRVGDRLHLLRPGRSVEGLGRIFSSTGSARVLEIEGRVATVEVDALYDAVRVGDLAVPQPAFRAVTGTAAATRGAPLEGRIVAFENPHSLQSIHDLAFVDLGGASGVEEGDELEAVLPPEPTQWGVRPEIVVARLRVVRVARHTASVKVIELERPALQSGLPVRLVAQVP